MSRRRWHIDDWGPLGLAESVIKSAAIVVAIVALATRGDGGDPTAAAIACAGVLAVATLGIVAAIADRIIEREVFAMAFVIVNVVGHVAAVGVALTLPDARAAVIAYCALMTLGDAIKMVFLHRRRFTVRGRLRCALRGGGRRRRAQLTPRSWRGTPRPVSASDHRRSARAIRRCR
jgi:hypothetical protein